MSKKLIQWECLLKVEGRIGGSHINDECKHPMILPKRSQVSSVFILSCHKRLVAQGERYDIK